MALYPSQAWCDEWKEAINADEAIAKSGKNWGVGFNGNWLFEITPGSGLEKKTFVYLEASEGKCSNACILDGLPEGKTGFHVTGSYADFKSVVKGDNDFLALVVKGTFKLQGDMFRLMRNAKFIRAVANSISSFESEYLGE
jgi:putative sterol carrier protein